MGIALIFLQRLLNLHRLMKTNYSEMFTDNELKKFKFTNRN
jgi:hypothetical protein